MVVAVGVGQAPRCSPCPPRPWRRRTAVRGPHRRRRRSGSAPPPGRRAGSAAACRSGRRSVFSGICTISGVAGPGTASHTSPPSSVTVLCWSARTTIWSWVRLWPRCQCLRICRARYGSPAHRSAFSAVNSRLRSAGSLVRRRIARRTSPWPPPGSRRCRPSRRGRFPSTRSPAPRTAAWCRRPASGPGPAVRSPAPGDRAVALPHLHAHPAQPARLLRNAAYLPALSPCE